MVKQNDKQQGRNCADTAFSTAAGAATVATFSATADHATVTTASHAADSRTFAGITTSHAAGGFARLSAGIALLATFGLVALLSSGCALTLSPPEHRAQQYSTAFSAYDAQTKERLRAATIASGDDRTAVYIALGNPQRRRIGYGREPKTGETLLLEFWDYSGYPTGKHEGQFMTLSNGGFASPLSTSSYGRATVEFADGRVRSYSHDPEQNVQDRGGRKMALPPDPHGRGL